MSHTSAQLKVEPLDEAYSRLNLSQLVQRVHDEPLNAGLRVDLIFALCQQGQRARAQQVFRDLQAMVKLPETIGYLLDRLFVQACPESVGGIETRALGSGILPGDSATFQARTIVGRASNVNAAPKPDGIALGEAGDLGFYTFAPSSRPKSSNYLEVGLDFAQSGPSFDLPLLGISPVRFQLSTSIRDYASAIEYNTVFLSGQATWPIQGNQTLQIHLGHWQLGSKGYETNLGVSYEKYETPLLGWSVSGFFGGGIEQTQVLQDSRFDSNRLMLYFGASHRLRYTGLWANGTWVWSLGGLYEEALSQRPGGNRLGLRAKGVLQVPNRLGKARVGLMAGLTNDQDAFNSLLFGNLKRQRRQFEFLFHQNLKEVLGVRPFVGFSWSSTEDTIDLFTVEAMQVQIGFGKAW